MAWLCDWPSRSSGMRRVPLRRGSRVMIQRVLARVSPSRVVQAVQLSRAAHFEVTFQGAQVGLAELGDVLAFQGQFQAFASFQAGAVDAGLQQRFGLGQHGPQQGEEKDAEATHCDFS